MISNTIVIIPAFNEESSITSVVESIRAALNDVDIVVIDDGSTDNTVVYAKNAGAKVLSLPCNMGYGVAIQTGYKYAMRLHYQYLVQMDADGQHEAEDINVLLNTLSQCNCDIVLGSRYLGNSTYCQTYYRKIGTIVFKFLLCVYSGKKITDPTTGFQAMNRRVIELFIKDLFPCDYPDADILFLLAKLGYRITEVPVRMYTNKSGKSMHRNPLHAFYYVFKMLLSMTLTLLRKHI